MKISLCMIVKNEAEVIGRCLESVLELVDEIIIVDTGSTDNTLDIVRRFPAQIFAFAWVNDFSKARNFAFSKATCEYLMWLDADDILKPTDQQAFLAMKNTWDDEIDMAMLKYDVAFDSFGNPTMSFYRERIMKRSMNYKWVDPVHEVIPPRGNIQYFAIAITHAKIKPHDLNRNLNIYQKMIDDHISMNPRQQYYYARELVDHNLLDEAIIQLNQVINHPQTWIENRLDAIRILASCYHKRNELFLAKSTLSLAFAYEPPRSVHCCEMGTLLMQEAQYEQAIFWFTLALQQKPPQSSYGFQEPDMYDYFPAMQLCVCYNHLNNLPKASYYNEIAGKRKPQDPNYLYNVAYFKKKAITM